jgi:hypothetical protein
LEGEVARIAQASRDLIDEFTRWGRGVESDFQTQERRINRHRVDLDNLGERADLLEGQVASLQVAEDRVAKEVIDLTVESDQEEVLDRAEDLPALGDLSLTPGTSQDVPVSGQLCIRSLGRINKPGPYPIPVGSRHRVGGIPRRRRLRLGVASGEPGRLSLSHLQEGGDSDGAGGDDSGSESRDE